MTQSTGPDLNKGNSATALTGPARRVHRAVLTAFAETGQAPARASLERITRRHGGDPRAVLAELSERDLLVFSDGGEIRAAYPFSPVPTGIRVSWAGGPVTYAMCAVDALGMSAMLGHPVTITAAEPATGHPITVEADGSTARWAPDSAVVFAGATADACCPSADRTCGYINFFTTAQAAKDWAACHPDVTGVILDQADALNRGITEFGEFLRD
jgi:hypothetical protein